MLAIFITSPWPLFYGKGMKTWEIRPYPTEYRGNVIFVDSNTNSAICRMRLIDCIPATRELWEMNFEKHRTSCSFDELPYRNESHPAYIWILQNDVVFPIPPIVTRTSSAPTQIIKDDFFYNIATTIPSFKPERIACKFIGDRMLLYWLKKSYFALIAVVNTKTRDTQIVSAEIAENEVEFILSQLSPT